MPAAAAHGQVPFRFDDVSAQRGIGSYRMAAGMGAGVAAADYDGDRDIDLFVPTAEGEADQLYQNIGNGKFVEVAADVGLDSTARSRTALWLDYDGDGDLDLLVATDHDWMTTGPYTLYRQDDGVFTDVTAGSGLDVPAPVREDHPIIPHRGGLCAGDINGDGHLDVYSLQWNGLPHLFLSNRDGTFHDITSSSGVDTALYYAHQPMMHDFDRDGWTDIYAAIDFLHNALYINQRNGTFVDVAAAAGADNAMNDMGMSLGDVDNDGDLDVYITNIFAPAGHNILLRNDTVDGDCAFVESSQAWHVDDGSWGWGCTFFDADNDGWLDIAATNGWWTPMFVDDTSRMFWSRMATAAKPGELVPFENVSDETGFNDSHYGSCLIAFDADRDGDLDLPDGYNSHAIGAIVRVQAGDLQLMRLITAGTSYLGQEPAEAFFGVGDATVVDSVVVEWPDGTETELTGVAVDQVIELRHP
jgi:hypothetical protein